MMTKQQAINWIYAMRARYKQSKWGLSSYQIHKCNQIRGWQWGWKGRGKHLLKDHPAFADIHPTLNKDVDVGSLSYGCKKVIWWVCPVCHLDYEMSVNIKTTGKGQRCPYCAGKRVHSTKSLLAVNPVLASEWHPKNTLRPDEVMPYSMKKVWWIGKECGHEWEASIGNRYGANSGCPYCSNNLTCKDNCLKAKCPKVYAMLDRKRNKKIDPDALPSYSEKKLWWITPRGKQIHTSPTNMVRTYGHL